MQSYSYSYSNAGVDDCEPNFEYEYEYEYEYEEEYEEEYEFYSVMTRGVDVLRGVHVAPGSLVPTAHRTE